MTRLVTILALVAGLIMVVHSYLPLIGQNERMRREIAKLDAQLEQETNTAIALRNEIRAMEHDPKTVERLAREKLGYAKPGETIIRFEQSAAIASH